MKRFLRLTKEAAFATYASGGDTCFPRLSESNSVGIMQAPEFYTIRDGSGLNVQAMAGTATTRVGGQIATEIGPTVAPFLVGWSCVRINTAQTAPWTTTEMPNDLASITADLGRAKFNSATPKRTKYRGVKCSQASFSCSKESPKLMGSFTCMGSVYDGNPFTSSADPTALEFPEPACSDQPWDVYLFQQLKGKVTIQGEARTNFESFSLQVTNQLVAYWDEDRFANAIRCVGRTVTATVRLRDKTTPDDWDDYLQGTTGAASFEFVSGTDSLKFDLKGNCYISQIDQDLPIDAEPYYTATITGQLDPATCVDFAATYTEPAPEE